MQRWNDIGVADELLLPIKVVVAVITYLLTFVLGGVVTVLLLLIYAVVAAEAKYIIETIKIGLCLPAI